MLILSPHMPRSPSPPGPENDRHDPKVDYMPNIWLITSTEPSAITRLPAFITS